MSDLMNTNYKKFSFDSDGAEKIKKIEDKGKNGAKRE